MGQIRTVPTKREEHIANGEQIVYSSFVRSEAAGRVARREAGVSRGAVHEPFSRRSQVPRAESLGRAAVGCPFLGLATIGRAAICRATVGRVPFGFAPFGRGNA